MGNFSNAHNVVNRKKMFGYPFRFTAVFKWLDKETDSVILGLKIIFRLLIINDIITITYECAASSLSLGLTDCGLSNFNTCKNIASPHSVWQRQKTLHLLIYLHAHTHTHSIKTIPRPTSSQPSCIVLIHKSPLPLLPAVS